uniref:Synapse associated protein 1 n=1 Tax=Cebus imitator TaxID=2715852 RepID=A0A2K5RXH0_CEBIM
MFRGLSSWLGLQQPAPEGSTPPEQPSETVAESAEEELQPAGDHELLHQAKDFGNYLFNFASAATKKITESVAETAQTIKKSVEEGKIDDIIDKTIIGDFQKEQKKFVEEQHTKKSEAAVPPWVDTNDEETIQQQILALSACWDYRREPPRPASVPFILTLSYGSLVLSFFKSVKEEVFWRNYFYRVSLIKQSAQLTALAAQQQAAGKEEKSNGREQDLPLTGTFLVEDSTLQKNLFLETQMKDSADWEKELQQELQEYEVVTESEKRDENWDKEIEKMLQEEN